MPMRLFQAVTGCYAALPIGGRVTHCTTSVRLCVPFRLLTQQPTGHTKFKFLVYVRRGNAVIAASDKKIKGNQHN